jgi:3-phenylpropionate/cinnamic acid dioxygenase small subunit
MAAMSTADHRDVHELLCRFMRAFDDKDWTALRDCLDTTVRCDYSSFRGTPPADVSGDRYVADRRAALSDLRMQHDFSNLTVAAEGDAAVARCNYVIHRFAADFDGVSPLGFFHSYGRYAFGLRRIAGRWRIAAITQQHLASHGNPGLHGGVRPASRD